MKKLVVTIRDVKAAFDRGRSLSSGCSIAEEFGHFALFVTRFCHDYRPIEDGPALKHYLGVHQGKRASRILENMLENGLVEDVGGGRFIPAFLSEKWDHIQVVRDLPINAGKFGRY
jgi:hypothetical protein